MTLELLPQKFSVCQIENPGQADLTAPFTFLSRTDEEISLVCESEKAPKDVLKREDGWRGLRIAGPLDFSLIGILAKIAGLLAAQKISIFALSTYNTDYVLVKEEKLSAALDTLKKSGYTLNALPQ
ncbi:MAG: ACT domain-containing protein [Clostridiales bacterium]|nr:ACT domain-containing protein [Clostridiales bacterium]